MSSVLKCLIIEAISRKDIIYALIFFMYKDTII